MRAATALDSRRVSCACLAYRTKRAAAFRSSMNTSESVGWGGQSWCSNGTKKEILKSVQPDFTRQVTGTVISIFISRGKENQVSWAASPSSSIVYYYLCSLATCNNFHLKPACPTFFILSLDVVEEFPEALAHCFLLAFPPDDCADPLCCLILTQFIVLCLKGSKSHSNRELGVDRY